jgi:hypothetical protein
LTLQQDGQTLGPTAVIGQIDVTAAQGPTPVSPQHGSDATIGGVRLLGYNQDRAEAAPGDPLLLTLFWQAPGPAPGMPERLTLQLRDAAGDEVAAWQVPPVRADYPPSAWTPGLLRGQQQLRLPATLPDGELQFWLEEVPLGALAVTAPPRTFEEPDYAAPVDATLGESARLAGYSLAPAGGIEALAETDASLRVRLVWQALAEMATSYRVFVHLVDGEGDLVAQADGEPADWTRPTTGWAPGEYIVDEHVLRLPDALPPGPLSLRVGLYEAATGTRLPGPEGDFITLPQ